MLAHTDKLAVFVAELFVYSTGLTFALQLAQHSSFADQRLVDAWLQPPHLVGKDRPFFGVDYADDRYTVHDSWAADDPAVATLAEVARRPWDRWPVLRPTGGRGRIGRCEVVRIPARASQRLARTLISGKVTRPYDEDTPEGQEASAEGVDRLRRRRWRPLNGTPRCMRLGITWKEMGPVWTR